MIVGLAAAHSIILRANMDQRLVDERRKAIRAGHGIATQGYSLECWRCGASGTVHPLSDNPGRTQFVGSLADSEACK